jgi:flagellin-like hook-associated protein FlgL
MKYGTPEYDLENAKKDIDMAIEKVLKIRSDIGSISKVEICPNFPFVSIENAHSQNSSYYSNRFDPTNLSHVEKGYENALKKIESVLRSVEEMHSANEEALKNNKETKQKIVDFMTTIGIPSNYTAYEYPTSRSKTKKPIPKTAAYISDINRVIDLNDSYETRLSEYKSMKDKITKEYEKYKLEIQKKEAEKIKQEKEDNDRMELARFQVKYDSKGYWDDILDIILNKNKYLRLAHFLLMNRNDWNDGYHYAECGLDGFDVVDNVDRDIHADISRHIINWDGDGRCFRDTTYSYNVLFGMVNDGDLLKDYNSVMEKIDH